MEDKAKKKIKFRIIFFKRAALIIFINIIIPSFVFSQGVDKTNMGFMFGLNVPISWGNLNGNYKSGWNFDMNFEHTVSNSIVLGGALDMSNQPGSYTEQLQTISYTKDVSMKFVSLDGYIKLQNNLAMENEWQFFLKAGGGFFVNTYGKELGGGGYTILFGPGLNNMLGRKGKITSGIEYRINNFEKDPVTQLQFKIGFSFCLNPK
ncbi:MAG: hypothetical protein JST55_14790 [Bacteroidetes bacterium]|nr:hypothetical protein [Bacteroidota bacterium]